MNLLKLIAKGRVTPIEKYGEDGSLMIVGYERKPGSRKAGQQYWLRKPRIVENAKPTAPVAP